VSPETSSRDDEGVPERFPRGRLLTRMRYSAETALGQLPLLLLAPVIGATVGAWWQLERSSDVIRHGLVVAVPSTPDVLVGTVIGGFGGVGVAFILAVVSASVSYRRRGDPVWEVVFRDLREIELRCRDVAIPVSVDGLGAVAALECCLKTPSGIVLSSLDRGDLFPQGVHEVAWFPKLESLEVGIYEARWYAPRDKPRLHEIASLKTERAPEGPTGAITDDRPA
jgi:hypothetical protein